ncbi:MAG: hypothetical protein GF317_15120, partial [Candidatus Lokiarchaeota archaeon]|nr:hypothetical protein [Candidatus Lokiarchaeota archaeon]
MKNIGKYLIEKQWSKWWRIPRLTLYFIGFFTYFWYFWSFIGLLIGLFYFVVSRDIAWKRNGIILSVSIAFITLLVFFYKGYPPLNLAIWTGISIIFGYFVILLIMEILKRKNKKISEIREYIFLSWSNVQIKYRKLTKVSVIIFPLISWSSV